MDEKTNVKRRRWWIVGTLACVGLAALMLPRLAETGQGDLGLSQAPLVTIIFDSSSSMQWTEEGEGKFPTLDNADSPYHRSAEPHNRHLETWESGESRLGFSASREFTDDGLEPLFDGDNTWMRSVGPCMVWQPAHYDGGKDWDHEHCDDYTRPPPAVCDAGDNDCSDVYPKHPDRWYGDLEDMEEEMWDEPRLRLTDDANTPRHIQVKQILTGDMRLNHQTGEPSGPGCWFVPRFRGATNEEQVCCLELDDNGRCCDDVNSSGGCDQEDRRFGLYPDYDDPVPHYQEVYDTQLDNGLLDSMGSTALFSLAAFDGYRDGAVQSDGWPYDTRDVMAGSSPYNGVEWDGYPDPNCDNEDDSSCYDMGLYRFIGPSQFDIGQGDRMRSSNHVQEAILDMGFLEYYDDEDEEDWLRTLDGDYGDGSVPVFEYAMGRQPIAQSSPFGPVFHDLHQFYLNGQEDLDGDEINPFADDPYMACRARHSVIFTDGIAEPEAPGGAGDGLGSTTLMGGGFGYLPDRFPYMTAEDAIEEMIDAVIDEMENASDEELDEQYIPRVHTLGVGVPRPGDELREDVLKKLATMAEKGRTCAQFYLPANYVPDGYPTGQFDEEDDRIYGDCNVSEATREEPCLVPQNLGDYEGYEYEAPDGDSINCEHPAVILTHDDRDSLREAFTLIFNEIAGMSGLSAPTVPSITNHVDRGAGEIGQYRIYSGFSVAGDNPHWKGLLERQFLGCQADGNIDVDPGTDGEDAEYSLHDDLLRLRADTGTDFEDLPEEAADGDRRRVFTSLPQFVAEEEDEELDSMGLGGLGGSEANNFFNMTYQLYSAGNDGDTFGDEYTIPGIDDYEQEETRIPFDFSSLTAAFDDGPGLSSSEFRDYWRVDDDDELRDAIDEYRGRTDFRSDRVLGAIRNSNPVTVGPPSLDLPIDSYRAFQRLYSTRTTMTYTSTLDGQLRAIYTGEPETVLVNNNLAEGDDPAVDGGDDNDGGDAKQQREAWAYIPQLLHRKMASFAPSTAPDSLMDGTPVVEDVRLCVRGAGYSANNRLCPETSRNAEWRTVLVQGLGLAGQGYFALDVTRPGFNDAVVMPDPIAMWEFGPDWEAMQLQEISNTDRYDNVGAIDGSESDCLEDLDDLPEVGGEEIENKWELSPMGASVGEPAIGTVNMEIGDGTVPRPVVVVGGGSSANAEVRDPFTARTLPGCADILGRAIYVIDLQSGELIRRFIGDDATDEIFEAQITGTPVLSGTRSSVSTRGFIGDDEGRMYRIDFSNPDPDEWAVTTFFDPQESGELEDFDETNDIAGPAAFKPAVTMGPNRELVLIYGLGPKDDSIDEDTVQMVISVREQFEFDTDTDEWDVEGELQWNHVFEGGDLATEIERITGNPVIFNNEVYFTTYVEDVEDRCAAGNSRIYRMGYLDGQGGWTEDVYASLDENTIDLGDDDLYIEPVDPVLIRGMTITMGPSCVRGGDDTFGQPVSQQPQLVAQTTGGSIASSDDAAGGTGAGSVGEIGSIAVGIDIPDSQSIPMSWSVLEH